jgi:anti-sigma factor RsiW
MNPTEFDDATLMAYADGALEPGDTRRVAEAAEADPTPSPRASTCSAKPARFWARWAPRGRRRHCPTTSPGG